MSTPTPEQPAAAIDIASADDKTTSTEPETSLVPRIPTPDGTNLPDSLLDATSGAEGPTGVARIQVQGLSDIVKVLRTGLIALVLPPAIVAVAALVSIAVMVYGAGKVLEGIGRGLAMVPELLWVMLVERHATDLGKVVKHAGQMVGWEGSSGRKIETGPIAL